MVEDADFKGGELTQALNDYLHGLKGLHVAIVCSDSELEIVQRELNDNLKKYIDISDSDLDEREGVPNGWESGSYVCYCRTGTPPEILKTIVAVMGYLGRDIRKAQDLVNETLGFQDDPESVWTKNVARWLNQVLLENLTEGCFADIKIVAVVPREAFNTFAIRVLYFPEFIECVLLEDSPTTEEEKELLRLFRQHNLTKKDIEKLSNTRTEIIDHIWNHLKNNLEKNQSYNEEELKRVIEGMISIHEIIEQNENLIDILSVPFERIIQSSLDKIHSFRVRDITLPYVLEKDRGGGGAIKIAMLGKTNNDLTKTRNENDESQLPSDRDDAR